MKTARIAAATLVLSIPLALPVGAQDPAIVRQAQRFPSFEIGELALSNFTPRHSTASQLYKALEPFYTRQIYVRSEEGVQSRLVFNMSTFSNTLVIYDSPEQTARIREAAAQLEEIAENQRELRELDAARPPTGDAEWWLAVGRAR